LPQVSGAQGWRILPGRDRDCHPWDGNCRSPLRNAALQLAMDRMYRTSCERHRPWVWGRGGSAGPALQPCGFSTAKSIIQFAGRKLPAGRAAGPEGGPCATGVCHRERVKPGSAYGLGASRAKDPRPVPTAPPASDCEFRNRQGSAGLALQPLRQAQGRLCGFSMWHSYSWLWAAQAGTSCHLEDGGISSRLWTPSGRGRRYT
jgi:hypothetical protein